MADNPPIIKSIACATVQGRKRDFVNVYGLDETGRVWQWNVQSGKWEPHRLREQSNRRDDRERDDPWDR